MVMQWPAERLMHSSASVNSHIGIIPERTCSLNFQMSVPEPMSRPLNLPFSIGPPDTMSAGKPQLAAPIKIEVVGLSHPPSNPTPSIAFTPIASPPPTLPQF